MKNFFIAAISMAMVSSAFAQLQPKGTWYLGTANAPEALNIFSDGLEMTPTIGYAISDNVVLTLDLGLGGSELVEPGLIRETEVVYSYTEDTLAAPSYYAQDSTAVPINDSTTIYIYDSTFVDAVYNTIDLDSTGTVTSSYTRTTETRKVNFAIGAQYFFSDNYFVRGAIRSMTHTTTTTDDLGTTEEETNSFGWSIGAGKFISVRENWYLTPEVRYTGNSTGDNASDGDLSFRVGLGLRF